MKTILSVLLLCGAAALSGSAQSAPSGPAAATEPVSSAAAIAAIPVTPDGYAVTEIGANHRRWTRVNAVADASGNLAYATNSYIELQDCLYYIRQGATGPEWAESKAEVEGFPGGAVARQGPNQMIFANDLATEGAIDAQTPAGRFRSHVLGLCYADSSLQTNIFIAEIKSCQGQIISPDQVLYPDALVGDGFTASIRYTYRVSGWEQDILIKDPGSVIAPEAYGLSSSSPTLTLQVITEFLDPPAAAQASRILMTAEGAAFQDDEVDWGLVKLGEGKAFFLGQSTDDEGIPVVKRWIEVDSRHVLVEEVPFSFLKKALLSKGQGASLAPRANSNRRLASLKGLPVLPPANGDTKPMELALGRSPEAGLVLDYTTITTTQSNYVFASDTTYYISGTNAVTLNGTTTIEGGTVIKFSNCPTTKLSLNGPLVSTARPYALALLTCRNDNTVGQNISGSTGVPSNTNAATYLDAAAAQTNAYKWLRFSYAGKALRGASLTNGVWHSQFVKCSTAVESTGSDPVPLRNVLIAQCTNGVVTLGSFTGEHLTVDQCTTLLSGSGSSGTLTNSLLTVVATNGNITASAGSAQFASGTGLYQPVGAGSYYLGAWTNNGTVALNTTLAADLKTLTMYPPIALPGTISDDTTLWPQAQRDTGIPVPGYHYTPLDYFASNVTLFAVLTLTHGVAVGLCGSYGFTFPYEEPPEEELPAMGKEGSQILPLTDSSGGNGGFTSFGLPCRLNTLVRARNVQEQAQVLGGGNLFYAAGPYPTLDLRFADIALAQGSLGGLLTTAFPYPSSGAISLKNCILLAGSICADTAGANDGSASFMNNVLDRCNVQFMYDANEANNFTLAMYNNLLRGGTMPLYYNYTDHAPWDIEDNLFDRCDNSVGGYESEYMTVGYNGFTTNTVNGLGGSNNKENLVADYQTGPLGPYYYPTNGGSYSLTNLINAGSTWATNIGLYHFTTTTNQVKEGSTKLDIGFHYVAVDANGNPIDTNGDGIPDYLSDGNGNGSVDSGEIGWNITGDLGLKVLITRPKNNSPVP